MKGAATILICATLILGSAQGYKKCTKDVTDEELFPHERCNRFYQCVGGVLVSQRCAADLRYNIETQKCDWPNRVQCGDRHDIESEELVEDESEEETVYDDPSQAPNICAAEGSNGALVAHEDCNRFYICSGGRPVAMECPNNLLYNPKKKQCDWAENVKCPVPRPEPEEQPKDEEEEDNPGNDDPSKAREICAAEGSDGVLVAHEYCDQFYKCSFRIRIALRCPARLLYNPRKEQCDWPNNVKCGNRIIPGADSGSEDDTNDDVDVGGHEDPSQAPRICAAAGSEGVLVAHEYCNRFYKCANGVPVALNCQEKLFYNPSKEQCDWAQNVDCTGRIV